MFASLFVGLLARLVYKIPHLMWASMFCQVLSSLGLSLLLLMDRLHLTLIERAFLR